MSITRETFAGTALSSAHIGQAACDNLVTYLNNLSNVAASEAAADSSEADAETAETHAETAQAAAEAALAALLAAFRTGTITIAQGAASGTATGLGAYNGKPVFAMINQAAADTTLTKLVRAHIASGTLTVQGDANATAAVTVRYFIDAR